MFDFDDGGAGTAVVIASSQAEPPGKGRHDSLQRAWSRFRRRHEKPLEAQHVARPDPSTRHPLAYDDRLSSTETTLQNLLGTLPIPHDRRHLLPARALGRRNTATARASARAEGANRVSARAQP
jgi:hypothetical protein